MHPILIDWGQIFIPSWHAFYVFGAVAAYLLLFFLRKKYTPHINDRDLAAVYGFCYLGGWFGARLFSIFNDQPEITWSQIPMQLLTLGPMTFYGGFLGAIAAGLLVIHIKKMEFADVLDMGMLAGLLALSVGRIGCFLNGDDYGVILAPGVQPFWSVSFPVLGDVSGGIYRYPVQLMETWMVGSIVWVFAAKFKGFRSRYFSGAVFLLAGMSYAVARFVLEFFRGDPRGSYFSGMVSTSQIISVLIIAVFIPLFLKRKRSTLN